MELSERQEKPKKVYNGNVTECALAITDQFMNPPIGREMEFSNLREHMVYPMVMAVVREQAANPFRNRVKEPLSAIRRQIYCQGRRGVGMKLAMMGGNLVIGRIGGGEEASDDWNKASKSTTVK